MHKVKKLICVMACASSVLVAPIQANASGAVAGVTVQGNGRVEARRSGPCKGHFLKMACVMFTFLG